MKSPSHVGRRAAFTLVEMLVSVAVVAILMLVLTQVLTGTQRTWSQAKARTEEFREARAAFEAIASRLSQATLNSYWGFKLDANGDPKVYQRQSELHFVSGPSAQLIGSQAPASGHAVFFQAPLGENLQSAPPTPSPEGLDSLLNGWGWYVTYGSDLTRRPAFLADSPVNPERKRFRLMEFRQATEKLSLFKSVTPPPPSPTSSNPNPPPPMPVPWIEDQKSKDDLYKWFKTELIADSEPLAENILAIFIQPLWPSTATNAVLDTSVAPSYHYDTRRHQWPDNTTLAEKCRHQLPPMIRLTLVALNEGDWANMDPEEADALAGQLRGFTNTTFFTTASKYEEDLMKLEQELTKLRLSSRIFSTTVQIPAAKLQSSTDD
jgi:uncharacterized protein (TIGR02599 family)